jgi:hypothetical protein
MIDEENIPTEFERYKFDQDLTLRKDELRFKERELELEKEKLVAGNLQESKKTIIATYGALAGVLAALGAATL